MATAALDVLPSLVVFCMFLRYKSRLRYAEELNPSCLQGRNSAGAGDARRTGEPTIPTNARSGKRKSSAYIPDEGPLISVADMNPSDRDAGY